MIQEKEGWLVGIKPSTRQEDGNSASGGFGLRNRYFPTFCKRRVCRGTGAWSNQEESPPIVFPS